MTLGIIAGAIIAGFIQGLSGFAFSLVATSIWIWFIEPQALVPIVLCSSLLGQIVSSYASIGKNFSMSRTSPFLIGGIVGVPIGVMIFHQINEVAFRLGVGLILIVYCSVMLADKGASRTIAGGKIADGVVGVISGIMGGVGGLSGPAPVIWCGLRGWDKNTQRATFQPLLILTGLLGILIYVLTGAISTETLHILAIVSPLVMLSSWMGAKVYGAVPESIFKKTLLLLLLLTGFFLIGPVTYDLLASYR